MEVASLVYNNLCTIDICISVSKGNFSKILSNKLFSYLGSIAYPLYLSHQVVLAAVKNIYRISCYL